MKRKQLIVSILGFVLWLGAGSVFADKIYLKNGKVYDGKIIGRSPRRYLFALDLDGSSVQLSFFTEDIEKVEWGKNTVQEQIPY